ncbi:MAG TPA: TIGR00159 family protein [Thermoflexia bacterium]|nr:TIGR00159 family protein [Thermoflexia bacterium]
MWEFSWLLERLSWLDLLDIFLVAFFFFGMFYTLRGTRAVPLVRGITALLVSLAFLSRIVRLHAFSWLVAQILPAILVGIPVLFQPELRRLLERLGRGSFLTFNSPPPHPQQQRVLDAVVEAARQLAEQKVGALIVFERETGLQDYIETGAPVDAQVTSELLTTIFDHHTILHDGAIIIRAGRLAAAACVMPLTSAALADRHLGLRHRAAIGATEDSDAIALVVSEERGSISLAHNGNLIRDLSSHRLSELLNTFLGGTRKPTFFQKWRAKS